MINRLRKQKPINLVMTLLVRDNEDLLRENIEYHLSQGVNHIIAMDNLSVDRSAEILKAYEKKGVLDYIYQPSDTYDQPAWVTEMARCAAGQYRADWVINNDADEFWWPVNPDQTLAECFAAVPVNVNVMHCQRNNFVLPIDAPEDVFYRRLIHKDLQSKNSLGESLPGKVAHRGSRWVKVHMGNHAVSWLGRQKVVENCVEIFHFPIRSVDQIINKIKTGGYALTQNTTGIGSEVTWSKLYEELNQSGHLDQFISENSFSEKRITQAIEQGRIVEDHRLCHYLEQLLKGTSKNYLT